MKLIIEIDEQHFEILQSAVRNGMGDNSQKIIANGIPLDVVLDKIRAEIKDIAFDWQEIDGEHESFMVVDLNDALEIIDRYREGENAWTHKEI